MKLETHAALLTAVISLTLALSLLFGGKRFRRSYRGKYVFLSVCIFFFLWNLGHFIYRISGEGQRLIFLTAWGFPCLSLLLFWRLWHTVYPSDRFRLGILAGGGFFVVIFLLFPQLRTFGRILGAIYLFLLTQLIFQEPRRSLYEVFVQGLVFVILILVMATIFIALVLGIGGDPRLFVINTLVASCVILILYEPIKNNVSTLATRLFLKEQVETQKLLGDLSEGMVGHIDVSSLLHFVTDTLTLSPRIETTSIYLYDESQNFRKMAATGKVEGLPETIQNGTFLEYLQNVQQPLFLESAGTDVSSDIFTAIVEAMQMLHAQITIPLIGKQGILGIWNIADRPSLEARSSVEQRLLVTLANQLATGIQNCKIYEQMRQQDQLATLGEMAAVLAHEIRNPLGAVKGAAQYLQPSMTDAQTKDFLQIIIDETNRLNNVVAHFLDYAKPSSLHLSLCNLNDLIQKMLLLVTVKKSDSIKILTDLDPNLPQMTLDAERMQGVMLNLLLNAFEAMPDGGQIKIQTRMRKMIEILISDTGVGVSPEMLGKIFRPFFTTKVKGTGLGLSICQRIVKLHGGRIEVESNEGNGTTVMIYLPV